MCVALPDAIKKVSDTVWEIPVTYKEGMRVPGRIYATEKLVNEMTRRLRAALERGLPPGDHQLRLLYAGRPLGYGFPSAVWPRWILGPA